MTSKHIDPHRRTGKTFSNLLEALRRASGGENVVYTTAHQHLRNWYLDGCSSLACSYLTLDATKCNRQRHTLSFPKAGRIYFCIRDNRLQDSLAGLKVDAYINDD